MLSIMASANGVDAPPSCSYQPSTRNCEQKMREPDVDLLWMSLRRSNCSSWAHLINIHSSIIRSSNCMYFCRTFLIEFVSLAILRSTRSSGSRTANSVKLLAGFHAQSTGEVCFATTGSSGDDGMQTFLNVAS